MASITSAADGAVNVASNWSPAQVPTSADDVTINHDMSVPSGVTFEPNSVAISGSSNSTRGRLIVSGTWNIGAGNCTPGNWNTWGCGSGGVIDLKGNNIVSTAYDNDNQIYNEVYAVGEAGNFWKIYDSVGGGVITGPSASVLRSKMTLQYGTVNIPTDYGWLAGQGRRALQPMFLDHVVFYDMGYFRLGEYCHGDEGYNITNVDFVGTNSSVVDGLTVIGEIGTFRFESHSDLGTVLVENITIDPGVTDAKLRINYNDFYTPVNLISNGCAIEQNNSTQSIDDSLIILTGASGGTILTGTNCSYDNVYTYTDTDNAHTIALREGSYTNGIVEATYADGLTDLADHFIAHNTGDMTVSGTLVIDGGGGVLANALGYSCTGDYAVSHNTIFVDISTASGAVYGNLARNESGGSWAGTLNLYDNLCYVNSNTSGDSDVRAANFVVSGDDQITAMDNNAYYGYSSTLSILYTGVTSATKSIGDTDYGESDIIGVDPQFVDKTRNLTSWQNTQNGGGDADAAIASALQINGYDQSTQTQIAANESGFEASTVISWVKTGFAPTNIAYEGTASDAGTIGAVAYTASLPNLSSPTDPIPFDSTDNTVTTSNFTGDLSSLTDQTSGYEFTITDQTDNTVTFDGQPLTTITEALSPVTTPIPVGAITLLGTYTGTDPDETATVATNTSLPSGWSAVTLSSSSNVAGTIGYGLNEVFSETCEDGFIAIYEDANASVYTDGTVYSNSDDQYFYLYNPTTYEMWGIRALWITEEEDTTAPTISSATTSVDGDTVTIEFDENVDVGEGGNGGLVIGATYGSVTLTPTTELPASSVEFSTSRKIENGEVLPGGYTQPGDGFEDESGNDLESTTFSITNNSKVHKVYSDASKTTPYTTAGVIARVLDQDLTDAVAPQTVDPDVNGYVQLTESLASGTYTLVATSSDGSLNAIGEHVVP